MGPPPEQRLGETVLMPWSARRPIRPGGLAVLMIGGTAADRLLQGFVLNDSPLVSRVESAEDADDALRQIAGDPERPDLIVAFCDGEGATVPVPDAARTLRLRLGPAAPLVVLLADRAEAAPLGLDGWDVAARLVKPLFREHCDWLISRLFCVPHG